MLVIFSHETAVPTLMSYHMCQFLSGPATNPHILSTRPQGARHGHVNTDIRNQSQQCWGPSGSSPLCEGVEVPSNTPQPLT